VNCKSRPCNYRLRGNGLARRAAIAWVAKPRGSTKFPVFFNTLDVLRSQSKTSPSRSTDIDVCAASHCGRNSEGERLKYTTVSNASPAPPGLPTLPQGCPKRSPWGPSLAQYPQHRRRPAAHAQQKSPPRRPSRQVVPPCRAAASWQTSAPLGDEGARCRSHHAWSTPRACYERGTARGR
jgi:hypothetical protein